MSTEIIAAIVTGVLVIAGSIVIFALESNRRNHDKGIRTRGNQSAEGRWQNILAIRRAAQRWINSKVQAISDPQLRGDLEKLTEHQYEEKARRALQSDEERHRFIEMMNKLNSLRKKTARPEDVEESRALAQKLGLAA
jgi:hypothetical protein